MIYAQADCARWDEWPLNFTLLFIKRLNTVESVVCIFVSLECSFLSNDVLVCFVNGLTILQSLQLLAFVCILLIPVLVLFCIDIYMLVYNLYTCYSKCN